MFGFEQGNITSHEFMFSHVFSNLNTVLKILHYQLEMLVTKNHFQYWIKQKINKKHFKVTTIQLFVYKKSH